MNYDQTHENNISLKCNCPFEIHVRPRTQYHARLCPPRLGHSLHQWAKHLSHTHTHTFVSVNYGGFP